MADKNKDAQSCKNCKYFVQHYIRFKTYFHPLDCGHCSNFKMSRDKRRSFPLAEGCGRWEQAEETKTADELQQIKNAVINMQKNMGDITSILSFIKQE